MYYCRSKNSKKVVFWKFDICVLDAWMSINFSVCVSHYSVMILSFSKFRNICILLMSFQMYDITSNSSKGGVTPYVEISTFDKFRPE